VGLTVFMACVGLGAGPSFFSGLQKSGLSLVFVGVVIAVLPHTVAILFGRYLLKMNPIIVLGACSGAGTITAALRAIQEEAQSELPALGYTVPYAIGNIVLTAWGPVLVVKRFGSSSERCWRNTGKPCATQAFIPPSTTIAFM